MSSKRPSSSAAAVEGNEDLLTEILAFLPAKLLVRFKLVSKRWESLISSPSFCRLHTVRRRPEPQSSLLFGCGGSKYVISNFTVSKLSVFHFPLASPKVDILQSCNGLLLLRSEEENERRYYVFNPTTLLQRDLSPLPCASGSIDSIYIIFDPSSSVDYRVVCFEPVKMSTVFHVYDSETHKWGEGVKLSKRAKSFRNGVSFNGGIYFVRLSTAFRFDLDGVVSKIPKSPSRGLENRKFAVESDGSLFCFTFSWRYGAEGVILHVSEMEKGSENVWRNKYRADMCVIVGEDEDSVDNVDNVYMIRGEKEKDAMMLLSLGHKILIYRFFNGKTKTLFRYFEDDLNNDLRRHVENAHHFIQTLAPV